MTKKTNGTLLSTMTSEVALLVHTSFILVLNMTDSKGKLYFWYFKVKHAIPNIKGHWPSSP